MLLCCCTTFLSPDLDTIRTPLFHVIYSFCMLQLPGVVGKWGLVRSSSGGGRPGVCNLYYIFHHCGFPAFLCRYLIHSTYLLNPVEECYVLQNSERFYCSSHRESRGTMRVLLFYAWGYSTSDQKYKIARESFNTNALYLQ